MTTHTPGPWEEYKGIVSAENGSVFSIADCRNAFVGSNWSGTDFATRSHRDANAQLVAAAPDLLGACMAMIEWDDREQDHSVDFHARMDLCRAAFDKARSAIAKATGA